jgi:hypothetical protein
MTCPKCGNEQPDVFSQCQKCRFIFPARPANTTGAFNATSAPLGDAGVSPSIPALLGALLGLIVIGVVLWWLWSPEGLPVPDGAYTNEEHQFAMSVPEGWMTLSKDNYQEMFQKLGDRFPKSMQEGLMERRIEVGFLKLMQETEFSPNINIVVMKSEIPELDEKQKDEATKAITSEFTRVMESYKLETSELITVDELTSLQLSGRARVKFKTAEAQKTFTEAPGGWRTYTGETPEQWKSYDLKMIQTIVPGKRRAYIITCTSDSAQFPEYRRAFDSSIESFRVLQHPARFGPIIMGGIQGGLIAMFGYLLYFIISPWVRRPRQKMELSVEMPEPPEQSGL